MIVNLVSFFNGLLTGTLLALVGSYAIIKTINGGGSDS